MVVVNISSAGCSEVKQQFQENILTMFRSLRVLSLSTLFFIAQASGDDVNSVCVVAGFKVNYSKITECCLQNFGGSSFKGNRVICTLPIGKKGYFRRCVKRLGYATSIEYDD
ncbi:hypothetical protein K7432_014379 [Basidiobolus ranarum]|uniref:Uncharacterized protein n=1 Tax=Basidiobolus ranarum TaxID=34480 RepID=A0ABR2WHT5_9FUNG